MGGDWPSQRRGRPRGRGSLAGGRPREGPWLAGPRTVNRALRPNGRARGYPRRAGGGTIADALTEKGALIAEAGHVLIQVNLVLVREPEV